MKIKLENLSFSYTLLSNTEKEVLSNVSFEIDNSELVGIVGHSGSGKTTLIQHFTGLLKPSKGRVVVDGRDIWEKPGTLSEIRRKIGIVFQFPETQLFEEHVFEDVAFGPKNFGLSKDEVEYRSKTALETVGFEFEKIRRRNPHLLSEGEKRRVALAGVIAMHPEMLVLDEPTAGLDPAGVRLMNDVLKAFHASGKSVVIVSHNIDELIKIADRIIVLDKGSLFFDSKKNQLLYNYNKLNKLKLAIPRRLVLYKTLKSHFNNEMKKKNDFDIFEKLNMDLNI